MTSAWTLLGLAVIGFAASPVAGQDIVTYTFSFVPNTSSLGGTNDGILYATLVSGSYSVAGTVCNYNFGYLEASVVCYQMGYDAIGFSIRDPSKRATGNVSMSDVNCTNRVDPNNLATYNIANCEKRSGIANIPQTCFDHSRDVHIYCPKNRTALSTTTTAVTTTPFPTLTCNATTVPRFRLANGYYGLLQYSPYGNGSWGTVCIEGMNVYAARMICLALCNNQNAVVQYAKVVSGIYTGDNSSSILMSNLNCKSTASSLADCTYQNNSGGCTHSQDAGLECGPVTQPVVPIPTPMISCSTQQVTVNFSVTNDYAFLNSSLITLIQSNNASCMDFNQTNANYVIVSIPLVGCNPIITSNTSYTIISYTLLRSVYSINSAVYRAPYTVSASCVIPKNHSDTEINNVNGVVNGPPVANLIFDQFNLTLFKDATYSTMLPMGSIISLQSTVYVRAQLLQSLSTSKLVLENCWATPTSSSTATPQLSIITSKCPALSGTQIEFYSDEEVRLQFPMFQLTGTNSQTLPIFLYCTGVSCDTRVSTLPVQCRRSCVARKRRDASWSFDGEMESASQLARRRRSIENIPAIGPFYAANNQPKLQSSLIVLWVLTGLTVLFIN